MHIKLCNGRNGLIWLAFSFCFFFLWKKFRYNNAVLWLFYFVSLTFNPICDRIITDFLYEGKEIFLFSPLKLKPAFKDYLWGGTKLRDNYNKKSSMEKIAESWSSKKILRFDNKISFANIWFLVSLWEHIIKAIRCVCYFNSISLHTLKSPYAWNI